MERLLKKSKTNGRIFVKRFVRDFFGLTCQACLRESCKCAPPEFVAVYIAQYESSRFESFPLLFAFE